MFPWLISALCHAVGLGALFTVQFRALVLPEDDAFDTALTEVTLLAAEPTPPCVVEPEPVHWPPIVEPPPVSPCPDPARDVLAAMPPVEDDLSLLALTPLPADVRDDDAEPVPEPPPPVPPLASPASMQELPAASAPVAAAAGPAQMPADSAGPAPAEGRGCGSVTKPVAVAGNPFPEYPRTARWARIEGTVLVRLSISAAGTVQDVEIAQSSGNNLLDEAARKTLRRWRFSPARHGSTAVPSIALVPVAFRLEEHKT